MPFRSRVLRTRRHLVTRPLLVLIAALIASVGVVGTVALSAEPSGGTLSQTETPRWSGSVEGFANSNICGAPGSGGLAQCDEYELTVDVDPKFWESFAGGAEVEFAPSAEDAAANVNAIVFDKDGARVATASATTPGIDQLIIPEASRAGSPYRVVVYNNATGDVTTTKYTAGARIEARAETPTSGGTSDKPIPTAPVSDAPCVDGFSAGVFPCQDVDLKSFLPISSLGGITPGETGDGTVDDVANDRLNDIWGWTDPETGKEYAIVGKRDGTAFVDVSDPSKPVYLGQLPTFGTDTPVAFNVWRDAKVYKDHAFIVSEEPAHGMQVFDLKRLRGLEGSRTRVFTEDTHYSGVGNTHNIAINEESGYAYLIGTNMCDGGSHIVDIRDPRAPAFAGCVEQDGYTHDNQCVIYRGPHAFYRGREICFDFNEDTLTIVDVTNKGEGADRPILSKLPYSGSAYTHQGWLTEDQRHVLMNDELDEQGSETNTTTRMVDVSRLDAPRLVGAYEHPTKAIDHNNYIKGSAAYQSNYRSGLRILDTRGVADGKLSTAGYFDVFPADDAAEFNGTWSNYPYFKSGNVIVSGIEQGLFVVRPRDAAGGTDGRFPGEPGDAEAAPRARPADTPAAPRAAPPAPPQTAPAPAASAPSSSGPSCTASAGFRSIDVDRRSGGRSLSLGFTRARSQPVAVDVFQQSVGRRVIGERLVARFTERSGSVTWNGRANRPGRRVTDGYYFVRYRMGTGATADTRRVALRRVRGRFTTRPEFYRRASCDLLRSFKLERPVFGGRANRALNVSYQLTRGARVTVEVLRGSRVVRRFATTQQQARRTYRLRFDAEGTPRGDHRVRITAARTGERTVTSTLTARRL